MQIYLRKVENIHKDAVQLRIFGVSCFDCTRQGDLNVRRKLSIVKTWNFSWIFSISLDGNLALNFGRMACVQNGPYLSGLQYAFAQAWPMCLHLESIDTNMDLDTDTNTGYEK